jgi:hypothetical protein
MQNIDLYYESLKQVYDQIEDWPKHKPSFGERLVDWLVGISGVLFFLSLIPIFPAILVFVGGQTGLVIGHIDLGVTTLGRFIVVWIVSTAATGIVFGLMLWINGKVDSAVESRKPPQTLSPEQLTFVAVYESYKELKIFFVSHIEQHINNSLKALRRLVSPRMLWRVSPSARRVAEEAGEGDFPDEELLYQRMYLREYRSFGRPTSSFAVQVSVAQSFLNTFEKYAWFQLDTTTKSVLQALISFPAKTYYRLLEKDDLPTVLSVLENLSRFLYAYLPEHQTYMEPEVLQKLQSDGRDALDSFVQQINDLAPYRPVVEKEKRPKPEIPPPGFGKKLSRLYIDNVFLRFAIWFTIILLLTSGIVYLVSQRVTQLDVNVMLSIIIGASATGAATLAAFTPRTPKEEIIRDQSNGPSED